MLGGKIFDAQDNPFLVGQMSKIRKERRREDGGTW